MTPQEAQPVMLELSGKIQAGVQELVKRSHEVAEAERQYRIRKARLWLEAPSGTAGLRQAWVDAESADLRYERDLADGLRDAAREALRARRQELSALQSLLAAFKSEADFARTSPREVSP